MPPARSRARWLAAVRDGGAAAGDLGTFLPYVLGVIGVGALAPVAIFGGFGMFYLLTALVYRLPVAVQPMKAVAAVVITGELSPAAIPVVGVVLGALLLTLAATGAIDRVCRLIPKHIVAGLQIGLGGMLAAFGLAMMTDAPAIGFGALAAVVAIMILTRLPAALIVVALAAVAAYLAGAGDGMVTTTAPQVMVWPGWDGLRNALEVGVLPQLPLTLANAIIVTAALARDLFGVRAHGVTERRLAMTTGVANLLLAPFGALPMCHGAGGLAAHYRFGARTALAPLLLGALFLAAALAVDDAVAVLALVPLPVVGALLVVSAVELAWTRRLVDAMPSCRPVIAATAVGTVLVNPAAGFAVGLVAEIVRRLWLRELRGERSRWAE
jgi:MFS superfamily sulfate permease-like transporter